MPCCHVALILGIFNMYFEFPRKIRKSPRNPGWFNSPLVVILIADSSSSFSGGYFLPNWHIAMPLGRGRVQNIIIGICYLYFPKQIRLFITCQRTALTLSIFCYIQKRVIHHESQNFLISFY